MAVTKKETAKAEAKTAPAKEVKPVEGKASEVKAEVKEAPKAETKKAAKAPAKKTAAAKKEAAPKKEAVKKTVVTEAVNFQFRGKSYTPDDLLKSCRDVWKYDLGGKEEDLKSIELYVKPEENTTYYVINGDVTGSFFI